MLHWLTRFGAASTHRFQAIHNFYVWLAERYFGTSCACWRLVFMSRSCKKWLVATGEKPFVGRISKLLDPARRVVRTWSRPIFAALNMRICVCAEARKNELITRATKRADPLIRSCRPGGCIQFLWGRFMQRRKKLPTFAERVTCVILVCDNYSSEFRV